MVAKTVRCTFNKNAAWNKVRDRKPVVLDLNCWIRMRDESSPVAIRIKDALRKLVADGLIFCPLSFGIVTELHKQGMDSRLRTGALMEELSLNVSYAINQEVFNWEVERLVRRERGIGVVDLSLTGLYVPICGYMRSTYNVECPDEDGFEGRIQKMRQALDSMTLTEMLKMDATDWEGQFVKQLTVPPLGVKVQRIRESSKGDKAKMQVIEANAALLLCVPKAISQCSPQVQRGFAEIMAAASAKASENKSPEDNLAAFAREFVKSLPALNNHVELVASLSQNPGQQFEINDFFDQQIMPVPLAYASVFVSQDRGIRDALRNRTGILKRGCCRYCSDLGELEEWLKAEVI